MLPQKKYLVSSEVHFRDNYTYALYYSTGNLLQYDGPGPCAVPHPCYRNFVINFDHRAAGQVARVIPLDSNRTSRSREGLGVLCKSI